MRHRLSKESLAVFGMTVATVTLMMVDDLGGRPSAPASESMALIGKVSPSLVSMTQHGAVSPFPARANHKDRTPLSLEVVSWGPPVVDYLRERTRLPDAFVLHAVESAIAASLQNGVDPALGIAGILLDPAIRTYAHEDAPRDIIVPAINVSVQNLRGALDQTNGDEILAFHKVGTRGDPMHILRIRDRILNIIEAESALPYQHQNKEIVREQKRRIPHP